MGNTCGGWDVGWHTNSSSWGWKGHCLSFAFALGFTLALGMKYVTFELELLGFDYAAFTFLLLTEKGFGMTLSMHK